MRVAIVGSGYVGLVTGACLAEMGHEVTNIDQDSAKIKSLQNGQLPIYEPGLEKLISQVKFTSDLGEGIREAEIIMLAVGTPSRQSDGQADLTYVFEAVRQIAAVLDHSAILVMKSTVPVGTCRQVAQMLAGKNCDVVSNPEFLREGSAIGDFRRPDRIVIGTLSERARAVMSELYRPLLSSRATTRDPWIPRQARNDSQGHPPILFTNWETAELIKYASNAFLAMKIAYVNQMADLCEKTGADIQELALGMGLDSRIGPKFLSPGPGYGGSCFPKDTQALSKMAQDCHSPVSIIDAVIKANRERMHNLAQRVLKIFDKHGGAAGKKLVVLGLTFKANTDDMREAPSKVILPILSAAGMQLRTYDPAVAPARPTFDNIDGVLILTEWPEFKQLDLKRVPIVIDFRNIFDPSEMKDLEYHSLGRGK